MSGGFFRGTSAEQDTRFSNKQAKLMKSQKFAPELDHLVDMTKVKADVIRPWIAKRVTELLGFEDEVLINFIYGLLDGKVVNGKEVQISLTGFMEKNTGKFMKELWSLLLTAQANATGVPQQFLDAKEEETRKRKEESDRIADEIQKKKEKELREFEEERSKRMAGGVDRSKKTNAMEPNSKQMRHRSSSACSEDEYKPVRRNGLQRRKSGSRSPNSADCSPSPRRGMTQLISRSRSQSVEIRKSRSISGSPQLRHDSISSERGHSSLRRRSATPRRRYSPRGSISPSRRRSSYFRQRSSSRSHRKSPSPMRRRQRSPYRRESLTPRHRSPSPIRRRPSPMRHRSPSPVRRRSPYMRRRSPSPMRRRFSPMHRRSRSPLRRRSPVAVRRRVPSPTRRRSPSPIRRRSPSPVRRRRRRSSSTPCQRSPSTVWRRSSFYGHKRSPSPSRAIHRSASPNKQNSASPGRDGPLSFGRRKSPKYQKSSSVYSPRQRIRIHEELSPTHASLRDKVDPVEMRRGLDSMTSRPLISLRSPQRDPNEHRDLNRKATSLSPLQDKSSNLIGSPQKARESSPNEDNWSSSPHESPFKQTRESTNLVSSQSRLHKPKEQFSRNKSPGTIGEEEKSNYSRKRHSNPKSLLNESTDPSKSSKQKDSSVYVHYKESRSTDRGNGPRASETPDKSKLRKDDQETSEKSFGKVGRLAHPNKKMSESSHIGHSVVDKQQLLDSVEGCVADMKSRSHSSNVKVSSRYIQPENVSKSKTTVEGQIRSLDSGSEENERHRAEVKGRRKHKRSHRKELLSDDDYSTESEIEERKEAKRRRKEEKRLRKEERRLRRKERHRIRDERRAEKLKEKSRDTVLPAAGSVKNQNDACGSDGEHGARHGSHSSNAEDSESEQKRLETELRKKALESLKAKKGLDL